MYFKNFYTKFNDVFFNFFSNSMTKFVYMFSFNVWLVPRFATTVLPFLLQIWKIYEQNLITLGFAATSLTYEICWKKLWNVEIEIEKSLFWNHMRILTNKWFEKLKVFHVFHFFSDNDSSFQNGSSKTKLLFWIYDK